MIATLSSTVPGATWLDTDGNVLHAHAGGIVKDRGLLRQLEPVVPNNNISLYNLDTWYWFGQNEEQGLPLFSGEHIISR